MEKYFFFAKNPCTLVVQALNLFFGDSMQGHNTVEVETGHEVFIEALGLAVLSDKIDDCGTLDTGKFIELDFQNGERFTMYENGSVWANVEEINWETQPFKFMKNWYMPNLIWDTPERNNYKKTPIPYEMPGCVFAQNEFGDTTIYTPEGNQYSVESNAHCYRVSYFGAKEFCFKEPFWANTFK